MFRKNDRKNRNFWRTAAHGRDSELVILTTVFPPSHCEQPADDSGSRRRERCVMIALFPCHGFSGVARVRSKCIIVMKELSISDIFSVIASVTRGYL